MRLVISRVHLQIVVCMQAEARWHDSAKLNRPDPQLLHGEALACKLKRDNAVGARRSKAIEASATLQL